MQPGFLLILLPGVNALIYHRVTARHIPEWHLAGGPVQPARLAGRMMSNTMTGAALLGYPEARRQVTQELKSIRKLPTE